MDDLITGTDTYEDALTLRQELTQLASKGKFEFRQWASNHQGLVPESESTKDSAVLTIPADQTKKTLGLSWHRQEDTLHYAIREIARHPRRITKRVMLSHVAQLIFWRSRAITR